MEKREFEEMCKKAGVKKEALCDTVFTRQFKETDKMRISRQRIIRLANLLDIEFFRTYFAWTFYYDNGEYQFINPHKNLKAYNFLIEIKGRVEK